MELSLWTSLETIEQEFLYIKKAFLNITEFFIKG